VIADHIQPHRGDWNAFWASPIKSLCAQHHSGGKQFEERRGFRNDIGPDGYPTDPRHM
jgi:5-methylcytosine-specific restriction protein A